jgi:hypothetical protein
MGAPLNLKKNGCTVEAMQPGTPAYALVEGFLTLQVLMWAMGFETLVALAYMRLEKAVRSKGRRGRLAV